jgi:hypothetical protein
MASCLLGELRPTNRLIDVHLVKPQDTDEAAQANGKHDYIYHSSAATGQPYVRSCCT